MDAPLSMVTQKGVSEKVRCKLGPDVRKDPVSERKASHGAGTATGKALRLVCLGSSKKPSVPGEQWVRERQVYIGGQKKGHG